MYVCLYIINFKQAELNLKRLKMKNLARKKCRHLLFSKMPKLKQNNPIVRFTKKNDCWESNG